MRGAWAVATRPLPPVPTLANSRAETVLPSATPSSIMAVVFGHRPRVQRLTSQWEIKVYGHCCLVVRVDGKTCQINAWQRGQPNKSRKSVAFTCLTGDEIIQWNHLKIDTTYAPANSLGQRVGPIFFGRDFKLSTMATTSGGTFGWFFSMRQVSSTDSRKPEEKWTCLQNKRGGDPSPSPVETTKIDRPSRKILPHRLHISYVCLISVQLCCVQFSCMSIFLYNVFAAALGLHWEPQETMVRYP